MARWTLHGIVGDPVIEYRWFGRWPTPAWLDRPQTRQRRRAKTRRQRILNAFSDWLRRWAVQMIEIDDA